MYIYKFLVVSVLNTAVDFAVFNLLFYLVGENRLVLVFFALKSAAFLVAVTNSYVWNSSWVFPSQSVAGIKRNHLNIFGKFVAVNIISFLVNVSVATLVFYLLRDSIQNHLLLTNISAVLGSMSGLILNFKGYKHLFIRN
jgi:putative flippase GtrA